MTRTRLVPTPLGDARLLTNAADRPAATLVLGHGASGGADAHDLVALATALPALGVTVVRMEQPWRVAGRRVAASPAGLDRAWMAVVGGLDVDGRLLVGGRSAGARVACRTAQDLRAAGVVALSFPLHPPGRPDRSRQAELRLPLDGGIPTLIVQGERDSFGRPQEFPAELAGTVVRVVPGADHSLAVRSTAGRAGSAARDRPDIGAMVVDQVSRWLRESGLLARR